MSTRIGTDADDTLDAHTFGDYNEANNYDGGLGYDVVIGGNQADTLAGESVSGEGGDDSIVGSSDLNPDVYEFSYDGGEGNDYIFCDIKNAAIRAGSGSDTIICGMSYDDNIDAGGGSDFVQVLDNAQYVRVSLGLDNDIFFDGQHGIFADGYFGTDTLSWEGTNGGVRVNLTTGRAQDFRFASFENVIGSTGNDSIVGSQVENVLRGKSGNDKISGVLGHDSLVGNAGRDHLYAGRADTLVGGGGADNFIIDNDTFDVGLSTGTVLIKDFSSGVDKINLRTAGDPDQSFTLIGSDEFHGTPMELYVQEDVGGFRIAGDVDGDAQADFQILVKGHIAPVEDDFIL